MAAGRARSADPVAAAREAVGEAFAGGGDPVLLLVFCSQRYASPLVLAEITAASGGLPMIGCTSAGEIHAVGARPVDPDGGLLVVAVGGHGFAARTAAVTDLSADPRGAGAALAERLLAEPSRGASGGVTGGNAGGDAEQPGQRVAILLTDGLAGQQQEVLRGAYGVFGAEVPLVGGAAGFDLDPGHTFQLAGGPDGGQLYADAVVGALLDSDGPLGIGVGHGWTRKGEPMLVTESVGSTVRRLDDRPALDAYLAALQAPEGLWSDPAAFPTFALTHPFGLLRRSGDEVRSVLSADYRARWLSCAAEVPQGALAWIMDGDAGSVLEASTAAAAEAVAALAGGDPLGLIAFDCVARRRVLGEALRVEEVGLIAKQARGGVLAGLYTHGEIARRAGIRGFHNKTLVVLAVG